MVSLIYSCQYCGKFTKSLDLELSIKLILSSLNKVRLSSKTSLFKPAVFNLSLSISIGFFSQVNLVLCNIFKALSLSFSCTEANSLSDSFLNLDMVMALFICSYFSSLFCFVFNSVHVISICQIYFPGP